MEGINRMTMFEQVKEFHERFGVQINVPFTEDALELRDKLMNEELFELEDEMFPNDKALLFEPIDYTKIDRAKMTKELADLLYVVLGTAVTFGLPIEQVFDAVHKSNMSKLGDDGKPVYREDGKVLKGPNYKAPDLTEFF